MAARAARDSGVALAPDDDLTSRRETLIRIVDRFQGTTQKSSGDDHASPQSFRRRVVSMVSFGGRDPTGAQPV